MAGVDLVVAALAAGASAGLTDTASSAVRDTYDSLREAVRRRFFARGADGECGEDSAQVLEASEEEPGVWQARLGELLSASGADQDPEILAAARSLLRELGVPGRQGPAPVVDAREAGALARMVDDPYESARSLWEVAGVMVSAGAGAGGGERTVRTVPQASSVRPSPWLAPSPNWTTGHRRWRSWWRRWPGRAMWTAPRPWLGPSTSRNGRRRRW